VRKRKEKKDKKNLLLSVLLGEWKEDGAGDDA
jgi:hypothetical protein